MQKKVAEKILQEIEVGYDLKATSFSDTRQRSWDLEFIRDYVQKGDKVLDFGCGNGRLLEKIRDIGIEYRGADVSQKLLEIAQAKYPELAGNFVKLTGQTSLPSTYLEQSKDFSGNLAKQSIEEGYSKNETSQELAQGLPFPDNFFNKTVSVAVFHHLPSRQVRFAAARELYRVTRPGGHVVVIVWNLWQWKYVGKIVKNWLRKIIGQSELDWNDCRIAFRGNGGEFFARYHHAFTEREIRRLFFLAGFKIEKVETNNGKNIVLIGKKI